ncbi:MAG: 2-succinyl-5-enolpyruvyl-6-hydroxy-3-cyclohexene-1-carboxylic-acid synthase [Actinomycetota bacterium]
MSTTAATFCATLVDEWVRAGVTAAFVAPGSRSTPVALALDARARTERRFRLHLFHDERAAAFAAVGHGLATGQPAVLTCTSGTAGAHFHAAVIEADLSSVPLIACTTDRPPELLDVGAPQTIDQNRLFGHSVRFYAQPGVPDESMRSSWRSLGSRLVAEAVGDGGRPGPVHVNLGFRDPLDAGPGPLPDGRPDGEPWHRDLRAGGRPTVSETQVDEIWASVRGLSGVVVAGRGTTDPASVLALARRLGWPVMADHRSGCRAEDQAVNHFDTLLRLPELATQPPDVALRFGEPLASKVLNQWLDAPDTFTVAALSRSRWIDPDRRADLVVEQEGLARDLLGRVPTDYRPASDADRWLDLDRAAKQAIADHLAAQPDVTEPGVARTVVGSLPAGATLVVASSMPVRDVEWYGPNRRDIRVLSNRGANGIDGLVATAAGVALTGAPTTLLIGDVAFLHDSSSLVALAERPVDLTIVVVDNDGGGIFSFLPQATSVAPATFETLFGTPHGTDLAALCRAHGITVRPWGPDALAPAEGGGGVRAVIARTDRARNVEVHRGLEAAVAAAVASAVGS